MVFIMALNVANIYTVIIVSSNNIGVTKSSQHSYAVIHLF